MTAEELKTFLERHKLSQCEFARLMGVTYVAVYHWTNNRRAVNRVTARLCRLFDKYPQLMKEFGKWAEAILFYLKTSRTALNFQFSAQIYQLKLWSTSKLYIFQVKGLPHLEFGITNDKNWMYLHVRLCGYLRRRGILAPIPLFVLVQQKMRAKISRRSVGEASK